MTIKIINALETPAAVLATLYYEDGMEAVQIDCNRPRLSSNLQNIGAYSPKLGKKVFPKDGANYMEAILLKYRSYMTAILIEENVPS